MSLVYTRTEPSRLAAAAWRLLSPLGSARNGPLFRLPPRAQTALAWAILDYAWGLWSRAERDRLLRLWGPDVRLEFHGIAWIETADYRGREGGAQFIEDWLSVWKDFRIETRSVSACASDALLAQFVMHATGVSSGADVELEIWQVLTPTAQGSVCMAQYTDKTEALKAVGAA